MKHAYLIPLALAALAGAGHAQTKIYRCGNSYTNSASEAQAKGCKLMEGGNVTVVEGTRVGGSGVKVATAPQSASAAAPRVDSDEQKARDSDARIILEAELKKAEARQAELVKEFNNGEPEKQGPEHRNHQKYLDRIAELKASIARNENDIAGIKRELARAGSK
ncbi:hypothetical protein GCM10027034_11910 [Ramlibacter solisilvae]|uniref:Signal peptide protein n=1 Tax=Ramlibacter tataouinensis TaxID=94132 RepID=A0A127JWZ7_9BURK|nr:hypothetical protein [Ramlibacter tataouinensis]AMO24526.1 signal peptide protein [Ramlibacter tataouinensis]